MFAFRHQIKISPRPLIYRSQAGFSLVECIIALLILMIVALSVVSVFDYSFRNNNSAKKRFGALMLARQRLEEARNIYFINLANGTVTENNVVSDGMKYKVVRTITDNDLVTDATAPGPETKLVTITVSPSESLVASDAITLTTYRSITRPGPNREPNNP